MNSQQFSPYPLEERLLQLLEQRKQLLEQHKQLLERHQQLEEERRHLLIRQLELAKKAHIFPSSHTSASDTSDS